MEEIQLYKGEDYTPAINLLDLFESVKIHTPDKQEIIITKVPGGYIYLMEGASCYVPSFWADGDY